MKDKGEQSTENSQTQNSTNSNNYNDFINSISTKTTSNMRSITEGFSLDTSKNNNDGN